MGEVTGIAWTDHTANFWIGCERVSPACDFCYADRDSKRLAAQHGLKLWEGDRYITKTAAANVAKWHHRALVAGVRRRVFCMSFGDLFEGGRTDIDEIRDTVVWPLIETCTSLDFLLLTKRPQNIRHMLPNAWLKSPRPNVWLGTTCEDQERAHERIPHLIEVPAAVHFVSYEPALEYVNFQKYLSPPAGGLVSWLIVGGESGPQARAFNVGWAREVVAQCRVEGAAPFVKQLGARPFSEEPTDGLHVGTWGNLKDRHGADMEEWPETVPRAREFPKAA